VSAQSAQPAGKASVTRKEAIIQAASRLFSEKGYKDTSVSEISAATGVAEGTIFYHFKTKEDLLLHILQGLKEEIVAEFSSFERQRETKKGLDMVEDAVSFYLYLAGRLQDSFLLLHRYFPYRLAEANPTCRGYLQEIYNCLVDIFEKPLVEGQRDGSVEDLPARKTALLIFTMVDGLVRFKNYNLYDAAALYGELISACRRMIEKRQEGGP